MKLIVTVILTSMISLAATADNLFLNTVSELSGRTVRTILEGSDRSKEDSSQTEEIIFEKEDYNSSPDLKSENLEREEENELMTILELEEERAKGDKK